MSTNMSYALGLFMAAVLLLATGCATQIPQEESMSLPVAAAAPRPAPPGPESYPAAVEEADAPPARPAGSGFVQVGSGRFTSSGSQPAGTRWNASETGDITLSFQGADLREVVKVVLGDILGVNYLISDKVRGQITLHTQSPVGRDALLPILESSLQMNGAALVVSGAGYQVIPEAEGARQGLAAGVGAAAGGGTGFRLQVVPLRYVGAGSVAKVIEPFVPVGATLQVDEANNLFLVAGPARQLAEFVQTLQLFDADWLAGMSFGLYPLEQAEAQPLVDELSKVFGLDVEGPLQGMIRLMPIERLNSVLVISKRPEYLDRVALMIARFDQGGGGGAGRTLNVYYLQHGQAAALAGVLNQLFTDQAGALPQATVGDRPGSDAGSGMANVEPADGAVAPPPPFGVGSEPAQTTGAQIIADEDNNALLVMATPAEYRVIERTMRKLDIPRRQVLVEATIAEVTLNDNLQYGVSWFLQSRPGARSIFSDMTHTIDRGSTSSDLFSYALSNAAGTLDLLFDLIASESKVKVLSSPQVLVVDNQTANIRVGTQIPVVTRSSQSTDAGDAPIIAETQYRDTGVLLQVTPRINAGGMVTLELSQEVSSPAPGTGDSNGNPPISQRTVTSVVTVQSGETVLLGGLISEDKTDTVSGVPGLAQIPGLGKLFSRTVDDVTRTELMVTITPTVINSGAEAREATQELRRRMRQMDTRLEPINLNLMPKQMLAPRPGAPQESP